MGGGKRVQIGAGREAREQGSSKMLWGMKTFYT